jgi:hypothetical protein
MYGIDVRSAGIIVVLATRCANKSSKEKRWGRVKVRRRLTEGHLDAFFSVKTDCWKVLRALSQNLLQIDSNSRKKRRKETHDVLYVVQFDLICDNAFGDAERGVGGHLDGSEVAGWESEFAQLGGAVSRWVVA